MKDPVRGYTLFALVVVAFALPLAGGGCDAPAPVKNVKNPDPAGKIPAYKEAVREHDKKAVRQMIKDLDSDDPAVRLFAIEGLRRLTGETFDYKYYDDDSARRPAVKRWQAWLDGKHDGGRNDEDGGGGGGGGGGRQQRRETVVQDNGSSGGSAVADDAPSKASGP